MTGEDSVGAVRIGTSGWNYSTWRGKFYPEGLARTRELTYFGGQFDTVEINSSFYRLHRASTYEKWAAAVPDGFEFAVKGWRMLTHMRRLRNIGDDLASFFNSGVLQLRDKLGPLLWQLPPSLKYDHDVLAEFLAQLPKTYGDAAELARSASPPPSGDTPEAETQPTLIDMTPPEPPGLADMPLRYALEPRNAGFDSPEALALLKEYDIALVMSDMNGRHPEYRQTTGDLVYVRLHGAPRVYFSNYSDQTLEEWAARIRTWRDEGRTTYCYFDNTGAGWAPYNAHTLQKFVESGRDADTPT